MTRSQFYAHHALWRQVCDQWGWKMVRGRLAGVEEARLGLFAQRVWEWAHQMAHDDLRAANVDDLRHALYLLATGKTRSSKINPGREYTRTLGWLGLCLDDSDINAATKAGMTPGDHHRSVVIWAMRRAGFSDAYIAAIAADVCNLSEANHPDWTAIALEDLDKLHEIVRQRARDHEQEQPTADDVPF